MTSLVQIFEVISSPNDYFLEGGNYDGDPMNTEENLVESIIFDTEWEADAFIEEFGTPRIPVTDNHPDVNSYYCAVKTPVSHDKPSYVMYEVSVNGREVAVEAKFVPCEEIRNPELVMARKNPGKAFRVVDGRVVELSINTEDENQQEGWITGWSSDVDWIIELQREIAN